MCGRVSQSKSPHDYGSVIGWQERPHPDPLHDYNVSPGKAPFLFHSLDGDVHAEQVYWGYKPSFVKLPLLVNARLEKATTGKLYKPLFTKGRVIVPGDGWYEWTGEKGHKQPHFIRLKSRKPIYMAGISAHRPGEEMKKEYGFVIVTAAAGGGLVDIHDRRPVCLLPEDAQMWMDLSLPLEQAEQIARELSIGPDEFEHHEVSTDVNNVRNTGPHLIEPL